MQTVIRSPKEAPVPTRGGRGRARYPWPELLAAGVGHSFVETAQEGEDVEKLAVSIQSAGYNWFRRQENENLTVTVRTNKDEGTVEVWLVEKMRTAGSDSGEDLPEDLPGRSELVAAGYTTIDAVRNIEDLTTVSGIGEKRMRQIREFLDGDPA